MSPVRIQSAGPLRTASPNVVSQAVVRMGSGGVDVTVCNRLLFKDIEARDCPCGRLTAGGDRYTVQEYGSVESDDVREDLDMVRPTLR
jgi:hypothetical protein